MSEVLDQGNGHVATEEVVLTGEVQDLEPRSRRSPPPCRRRRWWRRRSWPVPRPSLRSSTSAPTGCQRPRRRRNESVRVLGTRSFLVDVHTGPAPLIELRVEVRPRWPVRLPRGGGPDGLARVRNGVLERLIHLDGRPVFLRAAQPQRDRVVIGAQAGDRDAAAYGLSACASRSV